MSTADDVIAAVQSAQQQLDAALGQCAQAETSADSGAHVSGQIGSQSGVQAFQQMRSQLEAMQQQLDAARTAGDAVIATAQQLASGT